MLNPLDYESLALVVSFVSFCAITWAGSYFRKRSQKLEGDDREEFLFILGGTLTLLGLIIGFTFSMAVSRYDLRKQYEEQEANTIRYTMPSGIVIAGKPDLTSVESGNPTIYDVKTGQQKACNEVQVMLYMLLLPKSVAAYKPSRPSGCVLYTAGAVSIPPEAIDETFVKHFEYFVNVIGSGAAAMKAPSRNECRFCDIAKSECAERIEA